MISIKGRVFYPPPAPVDPPKVRRYHRKWTPEKIERLRAMYRDFTASEIGRELGVTATAVSQMAYRLGLVKTALRARRAA